MTIKNLASHTPEDIIDSEIAAYKIHCETKEKEYTLERLALVKTLFKHQEISHKVEEEEKK